MLFNSCCQAFLGTLDLKQLVLECNFTEEDARKVSGGGHHIDTRAWLCQAKLHTSMSAV